MARVLRFLFFDRTELFPLEVREAREEREREKSNE
jgi:hypothetical protein